MNIQFNYMYRDGANYKQFGNVVFTNTQQLSIDYINKRISEKLIDSLWFYAGQWGLKDLHHFDWDEEIDHMLHEYEDVELTNEEPTNGDIADFLLTIKSH